jgi:rod shape-determining protein MreC
MNESGSSGIQKIIISLFVVGILFLAIGGYLTPITQSIVKPILGSQGWITIRVQAYKEIFNAPADTIQLRQENAILQSEVASLQSQVVGLQQQVADTQRLEALLNFARTQRQNKYLAAQVIFRDPRAFMNFLIIDRGTDDGIRRGMPVVSAEGLVGRIDWVTSNAARVQLIIDSTSLVGVVIEPSKVDADLVGSVTSNLSIENIPQSASVQIGDLILTSGLGGKYPADIMIGQVASIRDQATDLFKVASVQPVVDFDKLQIVLVIQNFSPIDVTPLLPEGLIIQ